MFITIMRRIIIFLIMFVLSLLISNIFGVLNPEIVFFCMYIFVSILSTALNISRLSNIASKCEISSNLIGELALTTVLVDIGIFIAQIILAIIGSKIFGINFFLLFEIIIFSNCLNVDTDEEINLPN